MGERQDHAGGTGPGDPAALALGAAAILPIVTLFVYGGTGLRFHWLLPLAVVGSASLVAVGIRRSAGGGG